MDFSPLHSRFPQLAAKETRSLTVFKHDTLPADEYALLEFYCEDPDCDCRRVILYVVSRRRQHPLAVIGWEDRAFYRRWLDDDDPDNLAELQGPTLNRMSRQSRLAPARLEFVTEMLLSDDAYATRLARHYRLFKKALRKERKKRPPRRLGLCEKRDV